MSLVTQALVSDVVSECNATGTGPWTFFNVAGVTSGAVYDKITEANMFLQSMVGIGGTTPPNAFAIEQVKRFEVVYGSARLAADLVGVVITDGFNYNLGGLAVQRAGAEMQSYTTFIKNHLDVARTYIHALYQWFWVFNPDFPQGYRENGTPVTYWSVAASRYT